MVERRTLLSPLTAPACSGPLQALVSALPLGGTLFLFDFREFKFEVQQNIVGRCAQRGEMFIAWRFFTSKLRSAIAFCLPWQKCATGFRS
jgi:hypothetical protein